MVERGRDIIKPHVLLNTHILLEPMFELEGFQIIGRNLHCCSQAFDLCFSFNSTLPRTF